MFLDTPDYASQTIHGTGLVTLYFQHLPHKHDPIWLFNLGMFLPESLPLSVLECRPTSLGKLLFGKGSTQPLAFVVVPKLLDTLSNAFLSEECYMSMSIWGYI